MAYKDKDKQREANRLAQARRRASQGMTKGVTGQGVTGADVIPKFGLPDCECRHCRINRAGGGKLAINHGPYKAIWQLGKDEVNRVSLPGDPDYDSPYIPPITIHKGSEVGVTTWV